MCKNCEKKLDQILKLLKEVKIKPSLINIDDTIILKVREDGSGNVSGRITFAFNENLNTKMMTHFTRMMIKISPPPPMISSFFKLFK